MLRFASATFFAGLMKARFREVQSSVTVEAFLDGWLTATRNRLAATYLKRPVRGRCKAARSMTCVHAFASITLADGVSIKEVQSLMGHSSPTVTLSVYARSMEGLGRQAVNDLSRSLLAS